MGGRQLSQLDDLGVTHVTIFDDLFATNKARLREIATRFESAGLRSRIKSLAVNARADALDAETCDLLRALNVQIVGFGLESGSDRVLRYLKTQPRQCRCQPSGSSVRCVTTVCDQ